MCLKPVKGGAEDEERLDDLQSGLIFCRILAFGKFVHPQTR